MPHTMPLVNKLALIKTLSRLTDLPNGKARDFDELWTKVIAPTLPDVDVVCKWHDLLLQYVNDSDPIFFIREYAGPSGNGEILRRGFYNTTDYGFGTVYCDNSVPAYFYTMAFDGYVPDADDFKAIMKWRKFPCGFIQTKEENQYAAYFRGKSPDITGKGYKIAHIFSAGEEYNASAPYRSVGSFCDDVFPRGVNTDWSDVECDASGAYHYRHISLDSHKAAMAKSFAVAHFLRMVHPINYFLVPKLTNQYDKTTGIMQTNIVWWKTVTPGTVQISIEIGEDRDLINYVADKIKQRYSNIVGRDIYSEFLKLIYPDVHPTRPKNKIIDAEFGIAVWKKYQTELVAAGYTRGAKTPKVPKTTTKTKTAASTGAKHDNETVVFDILHSLIKTGKMTAVLLDELKKPSYAKNTFNISTYPVLLEEALFPASGYPRQKFYKNSKITIMGKTYLVCSQWIPERIALLENWYKSL